MGNQLRNQSDSLSSSSYQQPISGRDLGAVPAQPLFHTGMSFETRLWDIETFVLISPQTET